MIEALTGNYYLAIFLILGIIGLFYLIFYYMRKERLARYFLYGIILVFYYGILIPLIVSILPTPEEPDPIIQMGISYILGRINWQYVIVYNFIVNSQVVVSASSFTLEVSLFLECLLPFIIWVRKTTTKSEKGEWRYKRRKH